MHALLIFSNMLPVNNIHMQMCLNLITTKLLPTLSLSANIFISVYIFPELRSEVSRSSELHRQQIM